MNREEEHTEGGELPIESELAGRAGSVEFEIKAADAAVIEKEGAKLVVSASQDELNALLATDKEAELILVEAEVEEEVTRLVRDFDPAKERLKVDQAKFEKQDLGVSEADQQESQWGESPVSGWSVFAIAGGVVIALVLSLVVARGLMDADQANVVDQVPVVVMEDEMFAGSPEKWYRDRSGTIHADALELLRSYNTATDDVARSQWVRNPKEFLQRSPSWPIKFSVLVDDKNSQNWNISHVGEQGYLVLDARNEEYLPCRAYFVRSGEGLKLDWSASVGWSEISVSHIKKIARKQQDLLADPILLRCKISKRNDFYNKRYNDENYSAYQLSSADSMQELWGYARKDSELDHALKALLDHGSFVVSLKADKRVVLKVRVNEKEALPSQVELLELIQPEWIIN